MLQKYDFTQVQNKKANGIVPVARVRAVKAVPAKPDDRPLYVWLSPWGAGEPSYITEPLTIFPCPWFDQPFAFIVNEEEGKNQQPLSLAKIPVMLVPGEDIFVERRLIEQYLKDGLDVPDEFCDAIDNLVLYEIHVHRDRWLASPPVYRGAL